jgi:hypothetical protein
MRYLIGMTGVTTSGAHNALGIIRDELNLLHSNIRQPVIDAMAGMLKMSAHRIEHHVEPHCYFASCGMTAGELDKRFADVLQSANPHYFIDEISMRMKVADKLFGNVFFKGHIISGITTASEMTWIRKQGGTLLHVVPSNTALKKNVSFEDSDVVIVSSNAQPPTRRCLNGVIATLREQQKHVVH